MLIGYMRVSKADGSQSTDLQRDALLAAGVDQTQLVEDISPQHLKSAQNRLAKLTGTEVS